MGTRWKWSCVALSVACMICFTFALDVDSEIPEDWIDPTDMINFDYASKTNKKTNEYPTAELEIWKKDSSNQEQEEKNLPTEEIVTETETKPEYAQIPNKKLDADLAGESNCRSPFLRRYVSVLQKQLKKIGIPPHNERFELELRLDSRDWQELRKFSEECVANVQEVTHILETMVQNVHAPVKRAEDKWIWKFEDIFHMAFRDFVQIGVSVAIVTAVLTLEIISRISWSVQLKRLLVIAFFISIPMTYYHELKLAEAKHKARAADIPKECIGQSSNEGTGKIWPYLTSLFSVSKDPCVEYHANNLIDPFLTVTPLKAVAITITRTIVDPLEYVGTAFSKAFRNVFAELPLWLWAPAFVAIALAIVCVILLIAVFFGYNLSFNLPFWAGVQLGPAQVAQQNPHLTQTLEDNRRQVEFLQETIRGLGQREQQALPAPPTHGASPSRLSAIRDWFWHRGAQEQPGPPPAPPYPGSPTDPPQQPPVNDLPYPDFDPPPRTPQQCFQRRPRQRSSSEHSPSPTGFGDGLHMGDGVRRHTNAGIQRQSPMGAGDYNMPYIHLPGPSLSPRNAQPMADGESSGRNPIGFEHLVEQDEQDEDTQSDVKISSQMSKRITEFKRLNTPVEEEQVTASKAVGVAPRDTPTNYANISKESTEDEKVTQKKPPQGAEGGSLTRYDIAPNQGRESEIQEPQATDSKTVSDASEVSPTGIAEDQAATIPVQDIEVVKSNVGGDNVNGWDEVSAEGACGNSLKRDVQCKELSPQELMNVFQHEAEEGISLPLQD